MKTKLYVFAFFSIFSTAVGQIKPFMKVLSHDENDTERGKIDTSDIKTSLEEFELMSVQLYDDSEKMKFKRSNVTKRSYFHGEDSKGSTFNLLEKSGCDGERIFVGSVVDVKDDIVHKIIRNDRGETIVRSMPSSEFREINEDKRSSYGYDLTKANAEHADAEKRRKRPKNKKVYKQSIDVIDVMVVWTKHAECKNSLLSEGCNLTNVTTDNMKSLIDLAVQETNTAFELSKIYAGEKFFYIIILFIVACPHIDMFCQLTLYNMLY